MDWIREARLWAVSMGSGAFEVEEIHPFVQDDLVNDDVMILDAYNAIYVWIGTLSTEQERKNGMQTAIEYVDAAPDGRPANTPVWMLKSGEEPYVFTTHFHGWDFTKRKSTININDNLKSVRDTLAHYTRKYTYPIPCFHLFLMGKISRIVGQKLSQRNRHFTIGGLP